MSKYSLNKLLREINRNPIARERYAAEPAALADDYGLTEDERRAFLDYDIRNLYRLGAHGLILRPFTLLKQMPEDEYLRSIRG